MYEKVIEEATRLGAMKPYSPAIAWVWANGFPSKAAGEKFVEFLAANGFEHRGVYTDRGRSTYSVRYR